MIAPAVIKVYNSKPFQSLEEFVKESENTKIDFRFGHDVARRTLSGTIELPQCHCRSLALQAHYPQRLTPHLRFRGSPSFHINRLFRLSSPQSCVR